MTYQVDLHSLQLRHVEETWVELLNMAALCIEENIISSGLVHFQLVKLRETIRQAKDGSDYSGLGTCLEECQHLLMYCKAMYKARQPGK